MTQINMLEAKTDLSKWVKKLETKEEDVVVLARNGVPVAQLTLIPEQPAKERIGVAKGKFVVPSDFDEWDQEIDAMFGGDL